MELSFAICSGCALINFFALSHSVGMVSTYSYKLSTKLYFLLLSFMYLNGS